MFLLCVSGLVAAAQEGSRLDTLVVVNSKSRDSMALGTYYAEKWRIPEAHIQRVSVNPDAWDISNENFDRQLRDPIRAFLAEKQLRGQIRFIVLSMDMPIRVGDNAITGALYYGNKPRTPGNTHTCDLAPDSAHIYFMQEGAFSPRLYFREDPSPLVFMLAVPDIKSGKALIDRSVAATHSFPEGIFCLHGSRDAARNVRSRKYVIAERAFAELSGRLPPLSIASNQMPAVGTPVLGYMTGLATLVDSVKQNTFAPGAIGDHLTSCAGMLPDGGGIGQSTVWDWFRLGAVASYGTVAEPCNLLGKFPDPMLHFWYARGFTAGEAYWMSVKNPYQGLFAGDPLCAPFAAPPRVEILSPGAKSTVQPGESMSIRVSAHPQGTPPVHLDAFVDGRHVLEILRPIVPEGNQVFVEIGPERFVYSIKAGEQLPSIVASLAWVIQHRSAGRIRAAAVADRLEVIVKEPLDPDTDEPLHFRAGTEQGTADALYIGVRAGRADLAVMENGIGYAGALFHLGTAETFTFDYRWDALLGMGLENGLHTLTLVVRDGSAVESRSSTDFLFRVKR